MDEHSEHQDDRISELVMEDYRNRKKASWFNPEINLGHILMIGSILLTGVFTYANAQVYQAKQELRITALESSLLKMDATMKALADAQIQQQLTSRDIAASLQYLTHQHP